MIWSTNPATLRKNESLLRSSGMLQNTQLLENNFADKNTPHESVRYFVIPPISHQIGKLVIPYVELSANGQLNSRSPAFYAVTQRPDDAAYGKKSVIQRSQEAHVIAEDLALRKGIFTPWARATSEAFVSNLIPASYRNNYLQDRIVHLEALTSEVKEYEGLKPEQQNICVNELEVAVSALARQMA